MVAKSVLGIVALAGLLWGVVQVSGSSAATEHSSLLSNTTGVACIDDRSVRRECGNGIPIESSEIAISPDGKNGYRIISFFGADLERGGIYTYDRNPATGSLVQKDGTPGCIAQGRRKGCVVGRALRAGEEVVASSDGRNVYAATEDSIASFDRDPTTGILTQPAGAAGCIASNRKRSPTCALGKGLSGGGGAIAISPDGLNVYFNGRSLAVFDRDPTTGALTQKPGVEGAKPGDGDVIVSPDGKNVYAGTLNDEAIRTFDRDPGTGALTRVPGRAGCISEKGRGGCRRGREFPTYGLSISPDGRSVYGTGVRFFAFNDSAGLKILDRLPDGTLVQKPGRAGCFSNYSHGEGCAEAHSLRGTGATTVSADGKQVYVFRAFDWDAAIFIRHPSGRLTEAPDN